LIKPYKFNFTLYTERRKRKLSNFCCERTTPWQEEKPLKYFLPNRKVIIKNLIQSITETEEKRVTDEEIKNILQEKHNLTISRRSVNVYRQELKIHDSTQRKK